MLKKNYKYTGQIFNTKMVQTERKFIFYILYKGPTTMHYTVHLMFFELHNLSKV